MRRRVVRTLIVAILMAGAGGLTALWLRRPWRYWLLTRDPIRLSRVIGLETRHRIAGFSVDDELGHAVASAGDVDGDGRDDFLVGAPFDDVRTEADGRVLLYSGRTATILREWSGDAPGWNLGCAVANAGDVDADGTPDAVAGFEREADQAPGGARIFSGKTGAVLFTLNGHIQQDLFGHAVAGVGDVNGDGHGDVLVGAPGTWRDNAAGYARLFSGKTGQVITTLRGEDRPGDRFGFAVAAAGDVDRDGTPDLAVGAIGDAPNGPHSGRVYVFSGRTGARLFTHAGDAEWDELGHAVANAKDTNGDGHPELLVGAFLQRGIGYARLYSGKSGEVLWEAQGVEAKDAFGHSVGAGGDADGDGVPDLVVGAPDATVDGIHRIGFIRIYSGADGRLLLHHAGDRELMHFGYVVAFLGDVNGDFLDDVVAGTVVVKGVGEAQVSSACAVEPIQAQGELTLARSRDGFRVSGGPPRASGTLLVTGAVETRFTLDETGAAEVELTLSKPALAGRTVSIQARVETATAALSSPEVRARFCP